MSQVQFSLNALLDRQKLTKTKTSQAGRICFVEVLLLPMLTNESVPGCTPVCTCVHEPTTVETPTEHFALFFKNLVNLEF